MTNPRSLLALCTLLSVSTAALADQPYVVVVGRVVDEDVIEHVDYVCDPAATRSESSEPAMENLCYGGWVRWDLVVQRTVRGPPLRGRVRTALVLTSLHMPEWSRLFRSFVLLPLDAKSRQLLGADYQLVEFDRSARRLCSALPAADLHLAPWPYPPRKDDEAPCYDLRHAAKVPWTPTQAPAPVPLSN